MTVYRVVGLAAYQLAGEFKRGVYKLFDDYPRAARDFKYRDQVVEAAASVESNIAEGFGRGRPREMLMFYRIALGSNAEARTRTRDGVHRKYFPIADAAPVLQLGYRCERALRAFMRTLE